MEESGCLVGCKADYDLHKPSGDDTLERHCVLYSLGGGFLQGAEKPRRLAVGERLTTLRLVLDLIP